MGLYLGKDKISALRTIDKTTQSMKAYLEAGGKCGYSEATTFEGCWQASDWENVTDCTRMFYHCSKLTTIPAMVTINVTSMNRMFASCSKLTSVPEIGTRNVTNMDYMFSGCYELTSVPALDTSKVTSMNGAFENCNKLTSIQLMDTSKVTDMNYMFNGCTNLTTVPALDSSNVTNMEGIFNGCMNLKTIHMHGMKASFAISYSTDFTREALVEILNNLATVTTSKTLTMGSTNLAKLTDADKAIATGKGWKLK